MIAQSLSCNIISLVCQHIRHHHFVVSGTKSIMSGSRQCPILIETMSYVQMHMVLLIVVGLIVIICSIAIFVNVLTGRVIPAICTIYPPSSIIVYTIPCHICLLFTAKSGQSDSCAHVLPAHLTLIAQQIGLGALNITIRVHLRKAPAYMPSALFCRTVTKINIRFQHFAESIVHTTVEIQLGTYRSGVHTLGNSGI